MYYARGCRCTQGETAVSLPEGEKGGRYARGGRGEGRRSNPLLSPYSPSGREAAAPLSEAPPSLPYISAGAAIPSRARPLASVRRVAAVKARRAVRVGSGDVSTGQA